MSYLGKDIWSLILSYPLTFLEIINLRLVCRLFYDIMMTSKDMNFSDWNPNIYRVFRQVTNISIIMRGYMEQSFHISSSIKRLRVHIATIDTVICDQSALLINKIIMYSNWMSYIHITTKSNYLIIDNEKKEIYTDMNALLIFSVLPSYNIYYFRVSNQYILRRVKQYYHYSPTFGDVMNNSNNAQLDMRGINMRINVDVLDKPYCFDLVTRDTTKVILRDSNNLLMDMEDTDYHEVNVTNVNECKINVKIIKIA